MKKKALILYGSPHKNGHTQNALNQVLNELKNDYDFDFINAFKENITPCTEGGICEKNDTCAFPDFNKIDRLIRECDLLVIATPVYNASFPAPLKAIFDRTQLYYNMKTKLKINPFKHKKNAILVATYGSNDVSCEQVILKQLELFFALLNAKLLKAVFIGNTDKIKRRAD